MEFKGTKGKWYTRGKYVTSAEEDICEVFLWNDPLEMDEDVTCEEAVIIHKSNNKLIAHAPEMLEMLINIHKSAEALNLTGDINHEEIKALIKSATEVYNGN